MNTIAEMCIRSEASNLRDQVQTKNVCKQPFNCFFVVQCRSLFVLFLVNYPLGSDALQRHLAFIVKNMRNYDHEEGRQSAMLVRNERGIFQEFNFNRILAFIQSF